MADLKDDLYRRQEDHRWREKVDERLASLTTDTMVVQERLDEAEEKLSVLDNSVRGDPIKESGGLIERLHDQESKIARLWAVIFMDATGEHGIYEEWKRFKRQEQKEEKRLELHWKFYTAVIVAVISMVGLVATNLDKLKHFIHPPPPVETVKAPKTQRKASQPKPAVPPPYTEEP